VTKLVAGFCTCGRPAGAEALLRSIAAQEFVRTPRPGLSVLAVDNDADPDLERSLCRLAEELGLAIRCVPEPRRGLVHARNRLLDELPPDADRLAVFDDDEMLQPRCLDELSYALDRTGADVASGQVIPIARPDTPRWIRDGRFFTAPRRHRAADFESVRFCTMGAMIVRCDFLRKHSLRFRSEFNFTGSEDSRFFAEILEHGGHMVYTSRARVDHDVPASRRNLRYLLRREYRVGVGKGLVTRAADPAWTEKLGFSARSLGRLVLKSALLVPKTAAGLFREDHYARAKPLFDVVQMAGRLAGIAGRTSEQYRSERS